MFWRIKRWRKEQHEIRSLKRKIKQEQKRYAPSIDGAEDEDYRNVMLDDYFDAVNDYEVELGRKRTASLISKAKSMGIDVPAKRDQWFLDRTTLDGRPARLLSNVGEAQLRLLIRKQRQENIEWWLKVVSALTGLLGTLIGLVAILKK